MARVPISGVNDEAITGVATDVREMISGLDIDGDARTFFLRWMMIANEHASQIAVFEYYDSDEDTGPTAALQRGVIHVPPGETVLVEFEEPGQKFVTNLTCGVTNGTINTNGGVAAGGYLI